MSPMRDGRTNKQTTSEDRATQLLIWETLSLAINIEWKTELEELNNAILSWKKLAKVGKVDKNIQIQRILGKKLPILGTITWSKRANKFGQGLPFFNCEM